MKKIWFLVFLLFSTPVLSSDVTTELVIMIDSSSSVNDSDMMDIRNKIYNAIDNEIFLQEIQNYGNGSIYVSVYEYAYLNKGIAGEYRARGIIKNRSDLISFRESMFSSNRNIHGATYTFTALNNVINAMKFDDINSLQQTIILIGDGAADDSYMRAKDNYLTFFSPKNILDSNQRLSVIGLYLPDEPLTRFLDDQYGNIIAHGEKKYAAPLSQESLEKSLIEAVKLTVY